MPSEQRKPGWFTPGRLLAIFCFVNLFVYVDRGVIASNGVNGSPRTQALPEGTGIQGHFHLSLWADGLLPAAFMVGLLVASPIFAEASKHGNAFRLIGIGMGVWTVGVIGCAASPSFILLIICRMLVGAGEASFVSLAAPFIDDYAPANAKTQWFAAFYLCIPSGVALGYVYGGVIMQLNCSWRLAFLLEGLIMIPFVAFCFASRPLSLNASDPASRGSPKHRSYQQVVRDFLADVKQVLAHRTWVVLMVAYVLYVAVLGVYSYWGPRAGKALFAMQNADVVFGGVTIITGILGAVLGGLALDKIDVMLGAGQSLVNANLLCAASCLWGWLFVTVSFAASSNFTTFIILFAVGELGMFLLQAPVAALGMWCVPPLLRPLGISMLTITIHLFGDVPSPPLVGALEIALERGLPPDSREAAAKWRISMGITTLGLLGAGAAFLAGAVVSRNAPNYNDTGKGGQGHLPVTYDSLAEPLDDGPEAQLLDGDEEDSTMPQLLSAGPQTTVR